MWATSSCVDALAVSTRAALRLVADPRLISAELLILLVVALAFRHPISQAIGTAGEPLPALRNDVPVQLHTERFYDFPLETGYTAPPTVDDETAVPAVAAKRVHVSAPAARAAADYRVRNGDSLWRVAERRLGRHADVAAIARLTRTIYVANKSTIGPDPSQLIAGMSLTLR
jgi:hypothetical protein